MTSSPSFWDRRRAAVQAEADAESQLAKRELDLERAEALAEREDSEVLAEMGLPDPAGMQKGDDFAAFMAGDVPEHLRRQALRTLWRSNPVLACVDGLNEYDDDYRAAMLLNEPIKTAYQVGKGMMAHIEEMERKAKAAEEALANEALAEEDNVDEAEPETDLAVPEVEADGSMSEAASIGQAHSIPIETAEADLEAPTPRRMRFRFEEVGA